MYAPVPCALYAKQQERFNSVLVRNRVKQVVTTARVNLVLNYNSVQFGYHTVLIENRGADFVG